MIKPMKINELSSRTTDKIKDLFSNYVMYRGLNTAFRFLKSIVKDVDTIEEVILNFIKDVRYLEQKDIYKIEAIFEYLSPRKYIINGEYFLEPKVFERLMFLLFSEIYNNKLIQLDYKRKVESNVINELTQFWYPDHNYNISKVKILSNIFISIAILEKDDVLYSKIIFTLYSNNKFSNNEYYSKTLMYLTLGLYTYTHLESELLDKNFRDRLKPYVFMLLKNNKNNDNTNLKTLIDRHFKNIIDETAKIIFHDPLDGVFEYHYINMFVKTPVWTSDMKISFLFSLYLLYRYWLLNEEQRDGKIYNLIPNWTSLNRNEKNYFLYTITNNIITLDKKESSMQPYVFTDSFKEIFNMICSWLNLNLSYDYNSILEKIFYECNNKLKNLNFVKSIDSELKDDFNFSDNDLEKINYALKEKLIEYFGYDEAIISSINSVFSIKYIIDKDLFYNQSFHLTNIQNTVQRYLYRLIDNQFEKINVKMNLFDIPEILSKIEEKEINTKSGDFTQLINSTDDYLYKKLKYKESEMQYVNIPYYSWVYLNSTYSKFNSKIIGIKGRKLTSEEIEQYTNQFLFAYGYYVINGVYYTKNEAEEILLNKSLLCEIEMFFDTNLNPKSGFALIFDDK